MAPSDHEPIRLNPTLLDQLEQRWRDQNAYIASTLRPGLSDAEMDELTAGLGLTLPGEARQWWRWHDGADPQPSGSPAQLGGGNNAFLPLAVAVQHCAEVREMLQYAWGEDLGPDWSRNWLTLNSKEAPVIIDCGVGFDDPVPVRAFVFEDPSWGAEGVRSLGELVEIWIATIDSGGWFYNQDKQLWEQDLDKVDQRATLLNLI